MSPEAKDFLDKCFTMYSSNYKSSDEFFSEAAERPTAAMLLNHPFSKHDPDFNFSESKLGRYISPLTKLTLQGCAFWAEVRCFGQWYKVMECISTELCMVY